MFSGHTGTFSVEKQVRPSSSTTFVRLIGVRFPPRRRCSSEELDLRDRWVLRSREAVDSLDSLDFDEVERDFEPDFDLDSLDDDSDDEELESSVDSSEDELSWEHSALEQTFS